MLPFAICMMLIMSLISSNAVAIDNPIENPHPKKIIIIRADDIGYVNPALKWLSNIIIENDIKATYAVMPITLLGNKEIDYLTNLDKNCFEMAVHGYRHENLHGYSYYDQYNLIRNATDIMKVIFKTQPYTFVPPNGYANNNTTKVCKALGYHSISANTSIDENEVYNFRGDFYWENNWSTDPISHRNFTEFKEDFKKFYSSKSDYIYVINIHPSTFFFNNGTKIEDAKDFEESIEYMRLRNVVFMTMEQAYNYEEAINNTRLKRVELMAMERGN